MEIPQVDGNQEDQEKDDKKIIGRGFRPALKIPKNFPYPLELNQMDQYIELDFDEKRNRLYIGDDRRFSRAFVEVHPKGLRLMINNESMGGGPKDWVQYILPGELGLAKTVDLLTKENNNIKQIVDDADVKEKFTYQNARNTDMSYRDYSVISNLTWTAKEKIESLSLRNRKREIAGALLANDLWQKRGFVDKEKVAPKNFWQVVPVKELMIGDKRNLKRWWEDALIRSAKELPGSENHGLETYGKKSTLGVEIRELRRNHDHLTEEEYSEKEKSYRMYGVVERNAFLKIMRDKVKEGFLPKYPWEIRHWDNIPFESLKKSLLYGLHKMPEWEAYIKSGAPQIEGVIDILKNGLTTEENMYNVEENPKEYNKNRLKQKNKFFQPFKPDIEERIRQSLSLFAEGKISEAQRIFPDKNAFVYDNNNKFVGIHESYIKESIIRDKIKEKRETFVDIFKDKRKNQFISPEFECIDGWEWNKNETSVLELEIIKEEEKDYYQQLKNISIHNDEISKDEEIEILFKERIVKIEKVEKARLDNPRLLKCIAIKNENGIQKEVVLGIDPSDKNWYAIGYRNCDLIDLRKVKIFCRTLDAIKKELKQKINNDAVTTNIFKEKVIENPLILNSISQLNQTGGR